MRILIHDYCGHPFQVQLSRWLAAQGHDVLHIASLDIETPQGALAPRADDAPTLTLDPITLGRKLNKYNVAARLLQERAYTNELSARARAFRPDVVLSGNAPPTIQRALLRTTHRRGGRFVFWLQDIYGIVFRDAVQKRIPLAGPLLAAAVDRLERSVLRASDAVVAITDDFVPLLTARGVARERIAVIQNWAPREEIPERPRDNAWASAQGLADKFVFLYSGTLGLKHNPELLAALAERFADRPEVRIVVISNGLGRQYLEAEKAKRGLDNLKLYDFLPFDTLPDALGSADVLITILEPFAGVLSVPSKVLSYICAGRALLGAMPPENLAARIIADHGLGLTMPPDDAQAFVTAARALADDPAVCTTHANACRSYADQCFEIERVGVAFLKVLGSPSLQRTKKQTNIRIQHLPNETPH